jgi:8-oxo-dGTP pyrophosphatase MutT (NUDIX family)
VSSHDELSRSWEPPYYTPQTAHKEEVPRVFVAIIVRNPGGKFLFLHFVKKPVLRWRFAGGKKDAGEMLIVTAARELREEVGIEPLNLYLHSSHTERIDGGLWRGFYFVCDQYTGTPAVQEPSKHDAVEFFALHELSDDNVPAAEMSIVRSLSITT